MRAPVLFLPLLAVVLPSLAAQSNGVAGLDAKLISLNTLRAQGRLGAFPNGRNGLTAGVQICNVGTVPIDWLPAMNPRHPFYTFMLCRQNSGRFEQISDHSYVKHAFFPTNSNGCGICTFGSSSQLGPNCSDTYSSSLNANRYYLGPPEEIDPFLAAWNPVGSHFDRGEPDVGPPQNMDGIRSLTQAMANALDPVTHRIEVDDADLAIPDAKYVYGAYVVVVGEFESVRTDNMITRVTRPTWSGSSWTFTDQGGASNGSILQHWTGATVTSASNGSDDGRFYVGVLVTGPDANGRWHYEYAVHNRDNSRGGASFRVSTCPSARVLNAVARDIDKDPSNDWGAAVGGGEIAFVAGPGNALEWNSVYNFSFDCDAAPVSGSVIIDQARPGAGAASVVVNTTVPGTVYNPYLGDGCGAPAQSLYPAGSPPIATIPNATFGLRIENLQPGGVTTMFLGATSSNLNLGSGCTLFVNSPILVVGPLVADPSGVANLAVPIPADVAFEGIELFFQGIESFAGGPLFGALNLTNGLGVRIGNNTSSCP